MSENGDKCQDMKVTSLTQQLSRTGLSLSNTAAVNKVWTQTRSIITTLHVDTTCYSAACFLIPVSYLQQTSKQPVFLASTLTRRNISCTAPVTTPTVGCYTTTVSHSGRWTRHYVSDTRNISWKKRRVNPYYWKASVTSHFNSFHKDCDCLLLIVCSIRGDRWELD